MRKSTSQLLILIAAIAGWATVAMGSPQSILSIALTSLFVMLVPGYLALKSITRNKIQGWWIQLAFSSALSALFLMLLGLVMSVIEPALGMARPLTTGPLVIMIATVTAAMGVAASNRGINLAPPKLVWPKGWYSWLLGGFGALLPLGAMGGAAVLNNGGPNWLTLTMLAGCGLYMLALGLSNKRHVQEMYPYAIFMISAALLLATSMRGWLITGHDVMQEFYVFSLTAQHGVWSMGLLQNAYTACLSITILPTVIAKVTGLNDPYVFKFLFQILFAFMPVVMYLLLRRFLSNRVAMMSALVFVTFPTFLTDMPMLNRQEVAFVFLALMLYVLFDQQFSPRLRNGLALLLGLGMILSHYSTSYVAISILLLAKVIELGLNAVDFAWERMPRKGEHRIVKKRQFVPLTWFVTLSLVFGVWAWDGPITHTSQGIANTILGVVTGLTAITTDSAKSGASSYSLIGHNLSNNQLFANYTKGLDSARDLPSSAYYPAKLISKYPVLQAQAITAPLTIGGQVLSFMHVNPGALYNLVRSGYAKLLQLLIVLGLVVTAIKQRSLKVPRQFLILGVSGLIMIALQVLLPSNVIDYGILRLIQQCLMWLGPVIVLAAYWIMGWIKLPQVWRLRVVLIAIVAFFAVNSGLLPAITGGFQPDLVTSNNGLYYEAYYTHEDEVAGYQWLEANTTTSSVVDADAFAARKMITYSGIYARTNVEPEDIAQDAYVYLSYGDTTFNQIPIYDNGGNLLYELPPTTFLNNNKNLVYTNGAVQIYR